MLRRSLQESTAQRAARLRRWADAACDLRKDGVELIHREITATPNYHSWGLANVVGTFHVLDKVDGVWARTAARLLGEPTTPEGAKKDHETDHEVNRKLHTAVGEREIGNGHFIYGSFFLACNFLMEQRDQYLEGVREAARQDGLEAKSRSLGKWKQFILGITQTVSVSPLASPEVHPGVSQLVRPLVVGGMVTSTVLSGVSAFDVRQHIYEQRLALHEPSA